MGCRGSGLLGISCFFDPPSSQRSNALLKDAGIAQEACRVAYSPIYDKGHSGSVHRSVAGRVVIPATSASGNSTSIQFD